MLGYRPMPSTMHNPGNRSSYVKGLVVLLFLAGIGATQGACGGSLVDECAQLSVPACSYEARCLLDHSSDPDGNLRCVVRCNSDGTCEHGLIPTMIAAVKQRQGNTDTDDNPMVCACLAA